jgi:tripartite-type tricarboxylate transporter receptor subunit TctC
VPIDPLRDFEPVVHTATIPLILLVHPSVPARSVKELVELAKAQPGKLNFASSGEGTISHLAGELFRLMAGVDMVHVPYRGGGPARNALLGGHVQVNVGNMLAAASYVKAGQLRALGVSISSRAAGMPEIPTIAEAGLPGYEVVQWSGILAPAGTPKAIIAKLNGEVNRIIALADVRKYLIAGGAEPAGGTPEAFGAFLRADIAKWTRVVKDAKLRVNR